MREIRPVKQLREIRPATVTGAHVRFVNKQLVKLSVDDPKKLKTTDLHSEISYLV